MGYAVDCAEATNKGAAVDAGDLATWKMRTKKIQNQFVSGGSKNGDENGGVPNVKISVTGWVTMVRTIGPGGHGKLNHVQGSSARVFGQRKPVEVLSLIHI